MKKMFSAFMLALLVLSLLGSIGLAEDLSKLTDRFHGGLADIIERNMDEPQRCVREVDEYYQDNQAIITEIRRKTEKAMAHVGPMMEKMISEYSSMSEEELEAMEKKYEGMQTGMPHRPESAEMARYSQVMEAFAMKHPQKAMQFMPTSAMDKFPTNPIKNMNRR